MADIDTRLDGEGTESGPIWVDIDPISDVVTITWQNVGFYRRNAEAMCGCLPLCKENFDLLGT
jgi:hypothetical protein